VIDKTARDGLVGTAQELLSDPSLSDAARVTKLYLVASQLGTPITESDASALLEEVSGCAPDELAIPGQGVPSYKDFVVSAGELLLRVHPPLREIIPGLLIEGLSVLGGRAKMGKSVLVGNLGLAVGCGGVALGRYPVKAADVLLICMEDGERRLKRRLERWIGEGTVPRMTIATEWKRANEGGLEMIEGWLSDHPEAGLVIIDHLTLFRPRSESKSKRPFDEDYDAVRPLTELATKHRVAVVIVHHLNQRGEVNDPMELLSGTEGLPAGVDTAFILKRIRGASDAELHVAGRDVEGQELALSFDNDMWTWTVAGPVQPHYTEEEKETIDVVKELGQCGPKDLAAAAGISVATAKKRLTASRDRGVLTQPHGYGNYQLSTNTLHLVHLAHHLDDTEGERGE
jgi:AAA domain